VNDQRGQAQRARGQWTEILFFAIFRTFAMDTTLLRLIFIQNVKKGKNQPTLLYSTSTVSSLKHTIPSEYTEEHTVGKN
jgi:hypothetical protein